MIQPKQTSQIRFAVLTLSDKGATGKRQDTSGPLACEMLEGALGAHCVDTAILPDEREGIEETLIRLADQERCDLVLTTGGTGFAPRDVTPEATRAVIDREAPGVAEAMRAAGMAKTPFAMLSRGICGLRGHTMILNCSGSPKAVREQLEAVLPALGHALESLRGESEDCANWVRGKEGTGVQEA